MTRRSRATGTPRLITIYWRDIPAQVTADGGHEKEKVVLHHRFQNAIDRAAAVAGLTSAHDYVNEWRRVTRPVSGDLRAAADEEAARLAAEYPPSRLHALVKQGGLEGPTTVPIDEQQEATP